MVLSPANGPEREEETRVEDINSRGVFFFFQRALPLDRIVHLRIAMPATGTWMNRIVEVRAEGRVVRSMAPGTAAPAFGTAVEFTRPPMLLLESHHDD